MHYYYYYYLRQTMYIAESCICHTNLRHIATSGLMMEVGDSPVRDALDKRAATARDIWRCAENKPQLEMPLAAFEHMLHISEIWETDNGTPCTVWYAITYRSECKGHWERVKSANMAYPIVISRMRDGRWDILDGLHRYLRAKYTDHAPTIIACEITLKDVSI